MLTVLSYNILFGKRVEKIVTWLTREKNRFDVLCFQEFPEEKIPMIRQKLQPHAYAYASNTVYRGKDYGQLTLVMNKKIALVEEKVIWLGRNFFEDKLLRLGGERSSLLTKLDYNKKMFLLANTHLIAYASNALRRKQLTIITEYMDRMLRKEKIHSAVMLGDFNYSSLLWRKKLFALINNYGYVNAHTEKTHRLLFVKYHQLDYIFYKNCNVFDVNILQKSFSDHLPMTFSLQI